MKRLWATLAFVLTASFAVLGWVGTRIYQEMPPIPDRVVTSDGVEVIGPGEISDGQNVWQSLGGMEVGSVWGHGSYVAPDWTADALHRECVFLLGRWAWADFGQDYDALSIERQAQLRGRLEAMLRPNGYDPATRTLTIPAIRAEAFQDNVEHYQEVFMQGRPNYAIPRGAVSDSDRARKLTAFFFWTAWSACTNRPDQSISYTNNWPHEPLVGNRPTGESVAWTGVSVIMLLAGIGGMLWWYASQTNEGLERPHPEVDPLQSWEATPSQRATRIYFFVVAAMILVQMILGVITAHYGVEGDGFYGIPLSKWLPYSVTRTWHVQLGVLWIATSWLGAGLFIGPLIGGSEPKRQRPLVYLLLGALVLVVAGSMTGQYLSIANQMSDRASFYLGHQGYEYIDLGRVWQIALFGGLILWLFLVARSVVPALFRPSSPGERSLLSVLLLSTVAIGLFYGFGLMYGRKSHLSMVEYWRWWVVHLWVEGFFEVFATAVIAFFFARLGLVSMSLAAKSAVLSASLYLAGGIIGTCHHLYFSGTPTVALALGAVFSALEVVPLTLVAYSALEDLRMSGATAWSRQYKWPIYFFVAVAFWNMVGAGLFGFMINPPIALYFMQGLNTTPVHGHAALFGVYGMLGIGLMLMCLRAMSPGRVWKDGPIRFAFWSMNIGLMAMCVLSLLPVGLLQTWASVAEGYWYARSSEFLSSELLQTLRWLRVPGDTLFAAGELVLVLFLFGLGTGRSLEKQGETA
ncbi:MAG: nitric-oxide reductase large subunit [Isosphaeraceae bacterium]|nr:nitric-oxide reductase large subunit [Isosphaeraceae bacterium]